MLPSPSGAALSDALSPVRTITRAIDLIQKKPTGLIIGSVISFVVTMIGQVSSRLGGSVDPEMIRGMDGTAMAAIAGAFLVLIVVACVIAVLQGLFTLWFETGFLRVQADVLHEGEGAVSLLWSGVDRMWALFCWYFLVGTINFGVFSIAFTPALGVGFYFGWKQQWIPCILGASLLSLAALPVTLWFTLGLQWGSRWVALENLGPMEALERSWEMAAGRRIETWFLLLAQTLLNFVGFIMCGIGLIVTRPIAELAMTDAFFALKNELYPPVTTP